MAKFIDLLGEIAASLVLPLQSTAVAAVSSPANPHLKSRQIIAAVVNERLEIIVDLFDIGLEVISRAMRAKARNKDGAVIGPDHYARLTAASRLTTILTAGRPIPKAPANLAEPTSRRLSVAPAEVAGDGYFFVRAELAGSGR
jgi:hypothetical protein